ncbi:unnamed protein product [Trichogramma brassicae]|uniref:Uncharacterized protein n=1 Tax=Trichogramma brassicae TaxID=86971 RepID=A0A6H5J4A9_9HYME|nr:unnamed protein product [Trichogramma brassicae]
MVDVNRSDSADLVKMLLEPSSDEYEPVQVDARDSMGNTPLLLALSQGNKEVAEVLLRGGADPNLIYGSGGLTLLHIIGKRYLDDDFLEQLFNVCDDIHKMVPIDVFNNYGETPLTLVLLEHNEAKAELLLRRGANPNIVNTKGSTLLHVICKEDRDDKSAKILFKICDDVHQTVQLNAEDNDGNTPLQLAVSNLLPNTVEVLLNHGADLSKCLFPTLINPKWPYYSEKRKMRAASGALAVAELLETRGYDFSRSDAMTIMKFFAKLDLFEKSPDLERSGYYNILHTLPTRAYIAARGPRAWRSRSGSSSSSNSRSSLRSCYCNTATGFFSFYIRFSLSLSVFSLVATTVAAVDRNVSGSARLLRVMLNIHERRRSSSSSSSSEGREREAMLVYVYNSNGQQQQQQCADN